MKQYIGRLVVAAAMVLAVSGVARAHDDDDDVKPCRLSTLHGLYVFTASGFNIVGAAAQPKAIVELVDFNGHGTATGEKTTVSVNGMIRNSSGTPGTYTLDPDCTGHLKFMDGGPNPQFDLFVAFQGSQIQMIQTFQEAFAGLPVFQGTAERVSR
jgi:hypothetical protein